jgi:putative transposase
MTDPGPKDGAARSTSPDERETIWLADITYVETDQGWLYLATVMDLYSRRIVGWAMEDHLRADLPLAALKMAISAQRPDVLRGRS